MQTLHPDVHDLEAHPIQLDVGDDQTEEFYDAHMCDQCGDFFETLPDTCCRSQFCCRACTDRHREASWYGT